MAVKGPFQNHLFHDPKRYYGQSTDVKPTENVPPGSKYFEEDTGVRFRYTGDEWVEVTSYLEP